MLAVNLARRKLKVAAGLQLAGCQARKIAAGKTRGRRGRLIQVDGFIYIAVFQHERAGECHCLQVERAGNPGACHLHGTDGIAARTVLRSEQFDQQPGSYLPAAGPAIVVWRLGNMMRPGHSEGEEIEYAVGPPVRKTWAPQSPQPYMPAWPLVWHRVDRRPWKFRARSSVAGVQEAAKIGLVDDAATLVAGAEKNSRAISWRSRSVHPRSNDGLMILKSMK